MINYFLLIIMIILLNDNITNIFFILLGSILHFMSYYHEIEF